MPAIRQVEWLNENSGRAYPFQEDMQRIPHDALGNPIPTAQLPNYVVVDTVFTLPGPVDIRLYLGQLAVVGNLVTFVLNDTGTDSTVATVSVDRRTHVPNAAYGLVGVNEWSDARGWLTIGDLRNLDRDLAEGLYNFRPAQTLFEACTTRPALRGVRSVRVVDNGNISELLAGHVKLFAGENIRFAYDAANNGIWIHAEPNAGYKEECECEAQVQQNIVRTINGVPLRDATIVGDGECVEVRIEGNKIIIADKCSEPCCGCPELEFLTESIKVLESSITRLEEYSAKLAERITTFTSNFVMTVGR